MSGLVPVDEIARKLNLHAEELAVRFLPNGAYGERRKTWTASGIADTGKSHSLVVNLTGNRQGHWYDFGNCRSDEQRGDILDLVRLKEPGCHGDQIEAIRWAKSYLGIADDAKAHRAKPNPEELARRAEEARLRAEARQAEEARDLQLRMRGARALYLKGRPIAGTPAEAYLMARGLRPGPGGWPGALRYFPEVWNREVQTKEPAMLAPMYLADGTMTAVHRTWLQQGPQGGWSKLGVEKAKKALGPSKGAFIPIAKGSSGKPMARMPEGEPVYVTEGIEDALVVAMMLPTVRVIAAYSIANIGAVVLPSAARRLVVVADRDDSMAAQDQLERAIQRQQARGLQVEIVMPPAPHKDMNDWLRAWLAQGSAAA